MTAAADRVTRLEIWPVPRIGEVLAGEDLAALIVEGTSDLRVGEVLVVALKVVSKAEGRVVLGGDREAAIDAEMARLVGQRGATRSGRGDVLRRAPLLVVRVW